MRGRIVALSTVAVCLAVPASRAAQVSGCLLDGGCASQDRSHLTRGAYRNCASSDSTSGASVGSRVQLVGCYAAGRLDRPVAATLSAVALRPGERAGALDATRAARCVAG